MAVYTYQAPHWVMWVFSVGMLTFIEKRSIFQRFLIPWLRWFGEIAPIRTFMLTSLGRRHHAWFVLDSYHVLEKSKKSHLDDQLQRQIMFYAVDRGLDIITEYPAPTKRKFLILFDIDVAVMGQRWGGFEIDCDSAKRSRDGYLMDRLHYHQFNK